MTSTENAPDPQAMTRRAVVGAAGLGLLAACSSDPPPAVTTAPPAPSGTTTPAPTSAVPASAPPSSPPAPAPAPPRGVPLGKASAVPVGGGVIFAGQQVVVTQPQAGRYVGLSAVCPHQGCTVGGVSNGTITCPCHGSRFRLDGSVARGPATRALGRRTVTVQDGELRLG